MIRICFYNYGGGMLHVSRELEIDGEVDEYLIRHIPGLQLEATDSEADMDDNSIYYFSGKNEAEACGLAKELINSRIRRRSEMKYTIAVILTMVYPLYLKPVTQIYCCADICG